MARPPATAGKPFSLAEDICSATWQLAENLEIDILGGAVGVRV